VEVEAASPSVASPSLNALRNNRILLIPKYCPLTRMVAKEICHVPRTTRSKRKFIHWWIDATRKKGRKRKVKQNKNQNEMEENQQQCPVRHIWEPQQGQVQQQASAGSEVSSIFCYFVHYG
jgi:hypothetical protein